MRVPMSCTIDHQRIQFAQHLARRFARVAVERIERNPPLAAALEFCVRRFDHVVLHVRSKTMLRPEQRSHIQLLVSER